MSFPNCDGDNLSSKFEKDATDQHKILMNLKQQHEELDQETNQKIIDLNTAQKKKIILRDDIETRSIRTMKKEAALTKVQATLVRSQEDVKEIQNEIKKEKQLQVEYLKMYENRMASIADKLQSGPKFYDRKNVTAEISSLREEINTITNKLASVEEELNALHMKYASMFKESLDKPDITEGGALELSALQHVIFQMAQDIRLYHSEDQRLREELKDLSKMLISFQGDLKKLKQGHSIPE